LEKEMFPECFVVLFLLNIRIVDPMDIRNLLFKDHSHIESTTRSLEANPNPENKKYFE